MSVDVVCNSKTPVKPLGQLSAVCTDCAVFNLIDVYGEMAGDCRRESYVPPDVRLMGGASVGDRFSLPNENCDRFQTLPLIV